MAGGNRRALNAQLLLRATQNSTPGARQKQLQGNKNNTKRCVFCLQTRFFWVEDVFLLGFLSWWVFFVISVKNESLGETPNKVI